MTTISAHPHRRQALDTVNSGRPVHDGHFQPAVHLDLIHQAHDGRFGR